MLSQKDLRDIRELKRLYALRDRRSPLWAKTYYTDRVRQDLDVDLITVLGVRRGRLCSRIGLGVEAGSGEDAVRYLLTPLFVTPEELEEFCHDHLKELLAAAVSEEEL